LQKEVEKRGVLPERKGKLLIRETMNRKSILNNLHIIGHLLDDLVEKTNEKIERSKKIRQLLNLPQTVHNKARLTNYIKNGTE